MKFTMLFAMLFCPIMLMAQKVKTVAGEYTYAAPQNVTLREAKDYAFDVTPKSWTVYLICFDVVSCIVQDSCRA